MTSHRPRPESWSQRLRIYLCGFGMGAADLVPGISGGTVAFITGIYQHLLDSIVTINGHAIKNFLTLRWGACLHSVAWEFLAVLLLGMMTAMASLSQVIHAMLGDPSLRTYLFAAFVGLVIASVLFCARKVNVWGTTRYLALIFGSAFAFVITSPSGTSSHDDAAVYDVTVQEIALAKGSPNIQNFDPKSQRLLKVPENAMAAMWSKGFISGESVAYSYEQDREAAVSAFVLPQSRAVIDLWLLVCGAIAASAMLLPGISGSYILTILGAYTVVIGALADTVHSLRLSTFNADAFFAVFSVGLGAVLGIALFARLIRFLLRRYHDVTVALLTGFMIGALRSIWPFWSYTYLLIPLRLDRGPQLQVIDPILPDITSTLFWGSVLCAVIGFAFVVFAERFGRQQEG